MVQSDKSSPYIMQPDDITIIIEMCKLMNTAMHYEMLLQTVIDYCTRRMGVEAASVLLYDEKQDKLVFHVATGSKSEKLKTVLLNTNEGIAGWVFQNRQSIYTNDLSSDTRFSARVDEYTDFKTQSLLAVPLFLEDEVIGVFELVNKKSDNGFTERDLVLSEGMAAHVALAVERVHLISKNISVSRLAAIGETIAGLAHYIKNILTGLEGGAHLIRMALKDGDYKTVGKIWPMADRNINRISMLSMDMLEFSKTREPYYTCQDIHTVLDDVIQLFSGKCQADNVILDTRYNSSIPAFFFDTQAIHRCVLNLVSNSFDACKRVSEPHITISTSHLNGSSVIVDVTDNGSGMTRDTIEKILMSQFFSTKGSQGTGLGLPVVRKIIQEHHGSLDIRSELGQGTTFSICLPLLLEKPDPA